MKRRLVILLLLCLALLFASCSDDTDQQSSSEQGESQSETTNELYKELGAYDGYFEGESADFTIECISGAENAHTYQNGVITFGNACAGGVYSIKGKLKGSIVIDVGDSGKLELEMHGFSLISDTGCPVKVVSADKFSLCAKNEYSSYIYDKTAIDGAEGAIYSQADLEITGKGKLFVMSDNNGAVYCKKDLKIKNLSLVAISEGNALRGNDSVAIASATVKLISSAGNGIKTTKSDISSSGNQRGGVVINNAICDIYSALDGIDASYDVSISGTGTRLGIYTDKFSDFSKDVYEIAKDVYYIRAKTNQNKYSVKYVSAGGQTKWENALYHSATSDGKSTYYYYAFPKATEYEKLQFFVYSADMEQGQEQECVAYSDYLALNSDYDTIALTGDADSLVYRWMGYTSGGGGMHAGNADRGERSTKGIKASNRIIINGGETIIRAYDDALHARNTELLENGSDALGSIIISAGKLEIYSVDDGIHADGDLTISGGEISIINSYEGIEGTHVKITDGSLSIYAKDDGINATAHLGNAISIEGGRVYILCSGDGIDSNSASAYEGISFSGGQSIIITTSSKNSAIDAETGYSCTGAKVVAIMPQSGNVTETASARDFKEIGKISELSIKADEYLTFDWTNGTTVLKIPSTLLAYVVTLSDTEASVLVTETSSATLDSNGIKWSE